MALVVTSGAGKTTTAQLLMRFWDPESGRITLNGIDLRQYRLDDLRRRIALVAQDIGHQRGIFRSSRNDRRIAAAMPMRTRQPLRPYHATPASAPPG